MLDVLRHYQVGWLWENHFLDPFMARERAMEVLIFFSNFFVKSFTNVLLGGEERREGVVGYEIFFD